MNTSRTRIRNLSRILFYASCLLLCRAGVLKADAVVVDVSSGYIFDENGTSAANRLPVDSLCVLVADLGLNGFSPLTAAGWAGGDDRLITVSDSQFPSGTQSFSLASGVTEPGLFSRSLTIDLGQFGAFTDPIPFALLWFPGYKAGLTDISLGGPAVGAYYGLFSRAVPLYAQNGTQGWFITNTGGANITVDPFATSELGGIDASAGGVASRVVQVVPEPSTAVFGAIGGFGLCLRRTRSRRNDGR